MATPKKDPADFLPRPPGKYAGLVCSTEECEKDASTSWKGGPPICRGCYDRTRWRLAQADRRERARAEGKPLPKVKPNPDRYPRDDPRHPDWDPVADGKGRWVPTGRGTMVWRTCSPEQLRVAG